MLLETLLRVVNASNFLGIHELTPDGNSYDMIYTGQIKTRKELDRVIQKYGKREVLEIDTSVDEGQTLFIELERTNK